MCGIAGIFSKSVLSKEAADRINIMACALAHRGPDDRGSWIDFQRGIAFGHQRLAILDISAEGHQPMRSQSARYVLNYNGEIYNYREIQHELNSSGVTFRGHSDTEVILAAIEVWGLEAAVKKFTGMFAFGLWDDQENSLFLARDRVGEKPLYYGGIGGELFFSSELKAFQKHPQWKPDIDRSALGLLMRHGYIPAPLTIYTGIRKVMPGT